MPDSYHESSFVISSRLFRVMLVCLLLFIFIIGRLFFIQVVQHSFYRGLADDNRVVLLPIQPHRGTIYDRNGVVLATVLPHYTIDVGAFYLKKHPEFLETFSRFFPLSSEEKKFLLRLSQSFLDRRFITIKNHLTSQDLALFSAYRFLFPYAHLGSHYFRFYPYGSLASHLIGYMGQVDEHDWKYLQEQGDAGNYRGTVFLGRQGVEKQYESYLHGTVGYVASEATASGDVVRDLGFRKPHNGESIYLTIDVSLQAFSEQLMKGHRGVLIALDPQTGEILSFVSVPNVDPNFFSTGIGLVSWRKYLTDPNHPLINRATESVYPPGSTYKPYMALAALVMKYRTARQRIHDDGFFVLGKHIFRDDLVGGHGSIDMSDALSKSCDVYFFQLGYEMGPDVIHDFNQKFGFGEKTGIDLPYEVSGLLPTRRWKEERLHQKWYLGDSVSLGIGQGYNAFTPIQMAQALQVLATRGSMMQLHVVRAFRRGVSPEKKVVVLPQIKNQVHIEPGYWDTVIGGMIRSCLDGTARVAFRGVSYSVAGKTGTAQLVGLKGRKYDPSKTNEFKRDHSWFIAFAPAEAPQIAVVALVENGGWGARTAAPLVRSLMNFYFSHSSFPKKDKHVASA